VRIPEPHIQFAEWVRLGRIESGFLAQDTRVDGLPLEYSLRTWPIQTEPTCLMIVIHLGVWKQKAVGRCGYSRCKNRIGPTMLHMYPNVGDPSFGRLYIPGQYICANALEPLSAFVV